ncbi:MAG: McrB family protein [Haemophilus parainfluenzae]
MKVFITKITNEENVNKIKALKEFTHLDIYNFKDEIEVGSDVFFVFGGDKSRINWKQGLAGFGKVVKAPYDLGYSDNPRYFKIDIKPEYVLPDPIPPKETKLHKKYQEQLYDVPYVGANHFPNQAIAKTEGKGAQALYSLFYDYLPETKKSLISKDLLLVGDKSNSQVLESEKNALFKPFLILAGISGTGKTRFVRQQAERTGLDNYCLVSVRPDWHEPSDLLGYISHLGSQPKYITTDVLRFIVQAWKHISDSGFDLKTGKVTEEQLNEIQPYWLCLDEMNLAPVEQYFSDYLSILETRQWNGDVYQCDPLLKASALENIQPTDLGLSEGDILWEHFKENGISIPFNLIVAGTVNMDETTHGFSRKVLDRALSLDFNEFYPNDFNDYFSPNAQNKTFTYPIYSEASLSLNFDSPFVKESCEFLSEVNSVLKNSPFELAYRALNELLLSVKCINPKNEIELQSVWDDFLMMKVLPRIEGDSEKLDFDGEKSLLTNLEAIIKEQLSAIWEGKKRIDLFRETNEGDVINIECRSKAKISWMQTKLEKFGFTHFWK